MIRFSNSDCYQFFHYIEYIVGAYSRQLNISGEMLWQFACLLVKYKVDKVQPRVF